jgi:hypothetical protein
MMPGSGYGSVVIMIFHDALLPTKSQSVGAVVAVDDPLPGPDR